MLSTKDVYIHEIDTNTIVNILLKDPWQIPNQSVSSKDTNTNNKIDVDLEWADMKENTSGINAFYDITFAKHVKKIIDIGGGQFDSNRHYMKQKRNIDLLVWDPFNRSKEHNDTVHQEIMQQKADAATSMSVLNVIPEIEVRLQHINAVKSAIELGGLAYFKIWAGDHPVNGTYLPTESTTEYQTNAAPERFLREIEVVFGKGNVMVHNTISNLIVAVKKQDEPINEKEIAAIQQQSKKEHMRIAKYKAHSYTKLYKQSVDISLFFKNYRLMKQLSDKIIEQNRDKSVENQKNYDNRFGIVLST